MSGGPVPETALDHPAIATGAPLPDRRPPPVLIDAIAERLALWPKGELWTCDQGGRLQGQAYEALWRRSLTIAAGLAARGIGPGRILALAVRGALDFAPAFWAGLRCGCTILPLSGRAGQGRGEALAQVLTAVSDAVVLAETGSRAGEVAARLGLTFIAIEELEAAGAASETPARPLKGPACLLPTSGSTGRMKLAMLSEPALICRQFRRQALAAGPDDARLFAFDLDSVTGMGVVFLAAPRALLAPPSAAAGRPALLVEAVEAHRISRMALTCSLAGLLAEALERSGPAWDLSSLKQVNLGAETVDPIVAARLTDALARCGARELQIVAAYGSTETGNLATGARVPRAPPSGIAAPPLSLGTASRGVTLRIVGEDGAVLREGEIGAIEALAPELVFSGYWGEDSATAAAFSPDGWFRTGDLGALRSGQVNLHGRVKEMIIARGAKHALADIDAVLQATFRRVLPGRAGDRILSCGVRRPGEATERLAAMIFSAEPMATEEATALEPALRGAVAKNFGLGLKTIAHAPADRLPLGSSGKVMRRELAALLPSPAVAADVRPEPHGEDAGWLQTLWRQVLACPGPVAPESDFFELGGDSLASAQLFAALETRLDRRIPPDRFFDLPTFANLQALVETSATAGAAATAAAPAMHEKLLTRMAAWPGERPTRDRLLTGLNLSGSRPPLFWVFQGGAEFAALAEALGPDQPLYGFRSGHLVFRYTEDNVGEIAHRYVDDILEACPAGPLALGGNCQGGILALAMARRLVELDRPPELLVLMEWSFRPKPYSGSVLFLRGAEPQPRSQPMPTPDQLPGGFETRIIPGVHGGFFWPGNIEGLAAILKGDLLAATNAPSV